MSRAHALLTEAAAVGLTVRRRGDRLALVAPTPPPAALVERLRQAKPDLLAALPDGDKPTEAPFIAPDGTDDDAEERAAILEYDAHLPRHEAERLAGVPPPDDGPHEPCPKCGWRNFWRRSMTAEPWRCRQCVPPLPTIWTDGVFLPAAAPTKKGHRNHGS